MTPIEGHDAFLKRIADSTIPPGKIPPDNYKVKAEAAQGPPVSAVLEDLETLIEEVGDWDYTDYRHAEWQAAMRLYKVLRRQRHAYLDERQRIESSRPRPAPDPLSATHHRKQAQNAFRHMPWKGDLAPRGADGLISTVAKSFLNGATVIVYADTTDRCRRIVDLIEPQIAEERRPNDDD